MASKLFTAGQIGTLTLPNRVIRSATQDPFGRRDGTCAPEQVELYREIAAAGTGAIITAYSYISPEARSTGIQVGFVGIVNAHAELHRHWNIRAFRGANGSGDDIAKQFPFIGQC